MKKYEKNKGITLIALVITIIILLILAGITINFILKDNGIFRVASDTVKNYTDEQNRELNEIDKLFSSILVAGDSKITLTMQELDEYIENKLRQDIMQDVVLWEGNVSSGELELNDNIYNYKEILILCDNIYIQCPIIQGKTAIQSGGVRIFSDTEMPKCIIGVNGEIKNDGNTFNLKSANISYSNQTNNNYARNILIIIGRYKIK